MKELALNCNSPCWSCPIYGRVRRVNSFSERKIEGAYFCNHCNIYSLCKMGIAYNRDKRTNKLREICTKCGRYLEKIKITYSEGQGEKKFTKESIIIIRKPEGEKYTIIRSLKGVYFEDLAEILLYIISEIGSGYYNIVDYSTATNSYKSIYTGFLKPNEIIIKTIEEEIVQLSM